MIDTTGARSVVLCVERVGEALRRYIEAGGTRAEFLRAWLSLCAGQPASGCH